MSTPSPSDAATPKALRDRSTLQGATHAAGDGSHTPSILTVEKVAQLLETSATSVRRLAERGPRRGGLPARKIGRRWFFTRRAIEAHIEIGQDDAR